MTGYSTRVLFVILFLFIVASLCEARGNRGGGRGSRGGRVRYRGGSYRASSRGGGALTAGTIAGIVVGVVVGVVAIVMIVILIVYCSRKSNGSGNTNGVVLSENATKTPVPDNAHPDECLKDGPDSNGVQPPPYAEYENCAPPGGIPYAANPTYNGPENPPLYPHVQ